MKYLKWTFAAAALLLTLEAGLWFRFWVQAKNTPHLNVTQGLTKVVVIGDSVSGTGTGQVSYPDYMQKELDRATNGRRFEVINLSRPANVTFSVKQNLQAVLDTYDPRFVILMLGKSDYEFKRRSEGPWLGGLPNWLAKSQVIQLATLQMNSGFNPARLWNFLSKGKRDGEREQESEDRIVRMIKSEFPDVNRLAKKAQRAKEDNEFEDGEKYLDEAMSRLVQSDGRLNFPAQSSSIASMLAFFAASRGDMNKSDQFIEVASQDLEASTKSQSPHEVLSGLWLQYGLAQNARREFKKAQAAFRQVILMMPKSPEGYRLLGFAQVETQDWTGAFDNLAKSLEGAPNDRRVLRVIYNIAELNGDFKRAREILRNNLPKTDKKHLSLLLLASLEDELGNKPAAQEYLTESEKWLDDGGEEFRSRLWYATKTGKFEEVDRIFRKLPSDGAAPLIRRSARNLQDIVQTLIDKNVIPIVAQYPNGQTEGLESALHKFGANVKIVSTRDMLLEQTDGRQVHSFFAFDFNHLSPRGGEIVGNGLAKLILQLQPTSE